MVIHPAIDVQGAACVRLVRGDPDAAVRYPDPPEVVLERFRAGGAQCIHVVDVDGAVAAEPVQQNLVARLAAMDGLNIQVGGGVRTSHHVARWLETGCNRVVVGTAAVDRPDVVSDWIQVFGRDQIAASLDVRMVDGEPHVGSLSRPSEDGPTLWDALQRLYYAGLRHLIVSDRDREGELCGPNLGLVRELRRRRPDLRVQYGGGVRSADDVAALRDTGAVGVVIGRAFMDGALTVQEALRAAA